MSSNSIGNTTDMVISYYELGIHQIKTQKSSSKRPKICHYESN